MAVWGEEEVVEVTVAHAEDVGDDAVARAGADVGVEGLLSDAEGLTVVRIMVAEEGEGGVCLEAADNA